MPEALARFWQDPRTSDRDRKRIVRLVIEDVTVRKGEQISAQIRFKGGATKTLQVPLPLPLAQSRLTPPETLAALNELLDGYTDTEVAEQLNARGYRTFAGLPFQASHVSQLRRAHGRGRACVREPSGRRGLTTAPAASSLHDRLLLGRQLHRRREVEERALKRSLSS